MYYLHGDHLGTATFVTNSNAEPTQFFLNLPFGETMLEQMDGNYNNPFKFNAKELDEDTGLYYYGARYYNPRLSIWYGVDPLAEKYPSISPYVYVANNPLRYIDPDGRFLIDVHRRIVQNAFKQFMFNRGGIPSNDLQNFERAIVGSGISPYRGSVVAPDVRALPKILGGNGMESVDTQHFDNMNYSQVVQNFTKVNKEINDLLNQYGKGGINATQLGEEVGEYYHATADFYSHSNYVELYESMYGQRSVDMIPTLEDVQSNSKYSKFSELLKTSLVTGEYPGEGEGSHKSMNHDLGAGSNAIFSNVPEVRNKKVNWNSRAAEAVATKATVQYHGKILKKVK